MPVVVASTVAPWVATLGAGFTGLVVGYALGWLGCLARRARRAKVALDEPSSAHDGANEMERADMAAQRLRDLALNMASDARGHRQAVGDFSERLDLARQACNEESLAEAVAMMLTANEQLQARLSEAQNQIERQAEELKVRNAEARTDALTGLANRRAFNAALAECGEAFRHKQRPYSLVLLDLDGFKQLNDSLGHLVGDELLRAIGQALSSAVCEDALACRFGGEEFAILLPGTTLNTARDVGERLRKLIAETTAWHEDVEVCVTASVGVAQALEGEADLDVVRRADDAVYASKRSGRNVLHWHDGQSFHRLAGSKEGHSRRPRAGLTPRIRYADLPDRPSFLQTLRRQLAESRRFDVPLSVIHLELARISETIALNGPEGRQLQDAVADAVASCVREMDLVARLEEGCLALMLPGTGASAARIVGDRVAARVASLPIQLGGEQQHAELNYGIATADSQESAEQLLGRAKQALPAAAQSGETPPAEGSDGEEGLDHAEVAEAVDAVS